MYVCRMHKRLHTIFGGEVIANQESIIISSLNAQLCFHQQETTYKPTDLIGHMAAINRLVACHFVKSIVLL